jgi:hypothetical protein
MKGRIVVAGVLGGIAVFVWGVISHMVLPIGEMGVATLPEQEATLQYLGEHVPEHHMYVFPYFEDPAQLTEAYTRYPHGILVLTPPGAPFSFPRLLVMEALSNVVGALLVAFLMAAAAAALGGWGKRVAFGATLGAFASLAIDLSYWNWYGFPGVTFAGAFVDSVIAWTIAALVIGWWLGRGGAPAAATAS